MRLLNKILLFVPVVINWCIYVMLLKEKIWLFHISKWCIITCNLYIIRLSKDTILKIVLFDSWVILGWWLAVWIIYWSYIEKKNHILIALHGTSSILLNRCLNSIYVLYKHENYWICISKSYQWKGIWKISISHHIVDSFPSRTLQSFWSSIHVINRLSSFNTIAHEWYFIGFDSTSFLWIDAPLWALFSFGTLRGRHCRLAPDFRTPKRKVTMRITSKSTS